MTRKLSIFVVCAILAGSPALAGDDLKEREAVAREYLEMSLEAMGMSSLVDQMSAPLLRTIETRQPALFASKSAMLTGIVKDAMGENLRRSTLATDDDLARALTLDELVALRDFYASPLGKSVMAKLPAFMAEVMPNVIKQSMQDLDPMYRRLAAEGVNMK